MGQEVSQNEFSDQDRADFRRKMRHEAVYLKRYFDEREFDYSDIGSTGIELEGWLIDENRLPSPCSRSFIDAVDDRRVVPELSKFNFELNLDPLALHGDVLSRTQHELDTLWTQCEQSAGNLGIQTVAVGILPTVRDEMLQLEWMSNTNRYRALNRELSRQRRNTDLHIDIHGEESLNYRCDHIMLEAACTSLQAHYKVNQEDAVRMYNASLLASGPIIAATANSPFLYGRSLWAETRIPAFEQSTAAHGFRDVNGRSIQRVTLGTGYLRHSFLELFLENLSYPILLPSRIDAPPESLPHLRLQNGTIWRWNRPIIGFATDGKPHLRIEHRVMPSGPSRIDTVANLALYFGLALALAQAASPPELDTPFDATRSNFYACARHGLHADVEWEGKVVNVQSLLVERLLPLAQAALERAGVDHDDLGVYFHDVLAPRLRSGRTGTEWQRAFVDCNGRNFQALTERYVEFQRSGIPVHEWTV